MKVALFVHCFFPEHFYGTETYTYELARNLREMGHEATVVTAVFQGEPRRGALITRYEYRGVPVICIDRNETPHHRIRETYFHPGLKPALRQIVDELAPDVVHVTHLINHTAVLLDVLVEAGVPRVGSFTDFFGFCYNNKLEAADGSPCLGPNRWRTNCMSCHIKALRESGRSDLAEELSVPGVPSHLNGWLMPLRRFLSGKNEGPLAEAVTDIAERPGILRERYRHYAAAIASTKLLASAYRRNGIDVPIHRIPFGVDCSRAAKPRKTPGGPYTFGFIGQIAPHKGPDLLIEGFRRLPEGRAELVIYGPSRQDPSYFERLERAAAGLAVQFRGTFPPEELERIMAGIDALVIPSRWYENSPLVLLYALATHTPVIVTDLEGLTEFMEEGRNGFAFPKGDVSALTRAMRRFIDDPALFRRMCEQTHYDQTTRLMTEAVIKVYQEAIEKQCAAS